jgi:CDGSH-type Zn-finger protein
VSDQPSIQIIKNGPYSVEGHVPLDEQTIVSDEENTATEYRVDGQHPQQPHYLLCRCGRSANMPYCDGAHLHFRFDGRETASQEPFIEQAEVIEGPELILEDVVDLCALARFCHLGSGTWEQVQNPTGPEDREMAIRSACNCPAGRLVVRDAKTGEVIETPLEPSISVLYDEAAEAPGPLYVKGGIPITGVDGQTYEVRNRVTLCRCGRSFNKPFCDGSHLL